MTLVLAAVTGCATVPSIAPQAPATTSAEVTPTATGTEMMAPQRDFVRWVTRFQGIARAAGIDDETLRIAFGDIHYLPRVVELDQAQPEFTRTVWDYLDSAVSASRIALG